MAYLGAASSATAGAGRAATDTTDASFLNPASLAFVKGYIFSAGYSSASDHASSRGQEFALAVSDNLRETVVPTSLSFVQSKEDPLSSAQTTRDFKLNVGNFYQRNLALGIGIRFKDDETPYDRTTQGNLNLGALYTFGENWGFGALFENVLGSKNTVSPGLRLIPQTSFGISYIYQRFLRTRLDLISATNNSFDRPSIAAGLESYMNRWVIMRMGVQRQNETNSYIYSAGLGFSGPKIGVHYAYMSNPESDSFSRHTVDLSLPIW